AQHGLSPSATSARSAAAGEFSHADSVTFVILMSTFAQSCSEPPTRGLANANDYQRLPRRANSGSWVWLREGTISGHPNGRCAKRPGAENKDVCPSSGWEVGGLQRVCLQGKTRGDGRTRFSYHGRGNENHQQMERTTSGDGVADRQGGSPGVARSTCGR